MRKAVRKMDRDGLQDERMQSTRWREAVCKNKGGGSLRKMTDGLHVSSVTLMCVMRECPLCLNVDEGYYCGA